MRTFPSFSMNGYVISSSCERFHFLFFFIWLLEVVIEVAGVDAVCGHPALQNARDLVEWSSLGLGNANEDEQTDRRHHDQKWNEGKGAEGTCRGREGVNVTCESGMMYCWYEKSLIIYVELNIDWER